MDTARRYLVLLCATVMLAAACTVGGPGPTPSAGELTVTGAWVRPPLGPDRPAAGYLTITGATDAADTLVGATSEITATVEIHQTMAGASGMAAMHPVHRLEIPAGGTIVLEPGGYHLMLMDLATELVPGEAVEIILTFEVAGDVTVLAEVRPG